MDAPGYGPLQSPSVLAKLNESFYAPGGCRDLELACYAASESDAKGENGAGNSRLSDEVCRKADDFCVCFFAISLFRSARAASETWGLVNSSTTD